MSEANNRLIYPTIDLFLYDIASKLGQDEEDIKENLKNFWIKVEPSQKNPDSINELLKLSITDKRSIPLINARNSPYPHFNPVISPPFDGYLFPLKLYDSFALQVNCTYNPNPEILNDSQPITHLKDVKATIKSLVGDNPRGTLGQTWFVWGKLSTPDQSALEAAKDCYAALDLGEEFKWEQDYVTEINDIFMEAQWFEIRHSPTNTATADPHDYLQIIFCFFPYRVSMEKLKEKIEKIYLPFINIFLCRGKILSAFVLSHKAKKDLLEGSKQIKTLINSLPTIIANPPIDLDDLQAKLSKNLTLLATYSTDFTVLEELKNTLEINIINYRKFLKEIATEDQTAEPLFLSEFSTYAKQKYLQQVEFDCNFFRPELKMLENTIRTIEGIIQIEQAKSDRILQAEILKQDDREQQRGSWLAIFGAGLATGQIANSVILAQYPITEQNQNPQPKIDFIFTPHFLWSMGAGISASLIIWLLFFLHNLFFGSSSKK